MARVVAALAGDMVLVCKLLYWQETTSYAGAPLGCCCYWREGNGTDRRPHAMLLLCWRLLLLQVSFLLEVYGQLEEPDGLAGERRSNCFCC
jgi:hypothetical protein